MAILHSQFSIELTFENLSIAQTSTCCSVLRCVAVVLPCVVVVLPCVAVCCRVLPGVAVVLRELPCAAVCCGVLWYVAVVLQLCCGVLQLC